MTYLTTNEVLDLALGKQHDTSSGLRTRARAWLNEAMQMLYIERDWLCLHASADLTAASNALTKPDDYGRFRYAKAATSGREFFADHHHRLTELEAYQLTDDSDADPVPSGFYEEATKVYFVPGVSGSVTLGYVKVVPAYADNVITVLDAKFKNLLARAVVSAVYEYENDQRAIPSIQLDDALLSKLKAEENRQLAKPKRSKYLRGRA